MRKGECNLQVERFLRGFVFGFTFSVTSLLHSSIKATRLSAKPRGIQENRLPVEGNVPEASPRPPGGRVCKKLRNFVSFYGH